MYFFHSAVLFFNPKVASRREHGAQGGRRPGAGRPRLFKQKVRLAVDMEREDYEALRQISEDKGRSVPDLVRSAIKTLLKRHRRQ